MPHFDEQALARFALNADDCEDAAAIDAHVAECTDCRETLAFVRAFDRALREPEVWRGSDAHSLAQMPDVLERIRAFAAKVADEDRAAAELLAPLLANEAAFLFADITRKPHYRTGGVVRLLCRNANEQCEREPRYALALADAAIAIAELLSPETYPDSARWTLRGYAWKERANALRYLGRFPSALDAFQHAERSYQKLPSASIELAIVRFGRATVLAKSQELERAAELASVVANEFAELRDMGRFIHARMLAADVRYKQGRFAEALAIFLDMIGAVINLDDPILYARLLGNAGACELELRRFTEAEDTSRRRSAPIRSMALPRRRLPSAGPSHACRCCAAITRRHSGTSMRS